MTRPSVRLSVAAIVALQLALLAIGITRDYRLKHEDNNALHATFARAHLQLGFETTKGQNYFHHPATGAGEFYANHPPGPGLVLAAAYYLTGRDGPLVTRATAAAFHVLAGLLFLGLAGRIFPSQRQALLATLLFVLLPESAFFGRMLNHEVLVLPAALLVVRGYWEALEGGPHARRWLAAAVLGCVWAALAGWAGFFVMAACALHALWELAWSATRAPGAPSWYWPCSRRCCSRRTWRIWRGCRKAASATCASWRRHASALRAIAGPRGGSAASWSCTGAISA